MPPQPKPHLRGLPAPVHGGMAGHMAPCPAKVLDFSTCCNPYRPPAKIYSALRGTDIRQYPDPDSSELIRALSDLLAVPDTCLIAGSGSTEIIRMATTAYFGEGDKVIVPSPTYGEYELASLITGASVIKYTLAEKDGFRLDAGSLVSFAKAYHPSGIFICNPNNPTGQYKPSKEIKRVLDSFPDSLIILDEAYITFSGGVQDSIKLLKAGNLLIIRSMTKDYSIAGLRLGYAVSSEQIIATLKKVRSPWNVSSPAQRAGVACLACSEHVSICMDRIHASRLYLAGELQKLGFKVIPTDANFFIFKVGDAGRFKRQMLTRGILVRDCTSFGLPGYVRIAPASRRDCVKFVNAVREVKGQPQ